MRKIIPLVVVTAGFSFAGEKVSLYQIKDKKIIRCLSEYIKNNKTHITMIIDEKGKRQLQIPVEYVDECRQRIKN